MIVSSYCTTVDGSTDNTQCMQAAISAACGQTGSDALGSGAGGTIYFPTGTYVFSSLNVPCQGLTLQGAGRNDNGHSGGTVFQVRNNSAPAIQFLASGVSGNYSYSGGVKDLGFVHGGGNGLVPDIQINYCMGCSVQNVSFQNSYKAVEVFAGINNTLSNIFVDQLQGGGTAIEFHGLYTNSGNCMNVANCDQRADELNLNNIYVGPSASLSSTSTCLYWHDFAATINLKGFACEQQGYGLRSDCNGNGLGDSSMCPQFLEAENFQCVGCLSGVAAIDTGSLNFFNSYITGTPSTNNLVSIKTAKFPNSYDAASFVNGEVAVSGASCMWLAASDIVVSGMSIGACNLGNVGGAAIQVTNSFSAPGQATKNLNLNHNTFCALPNLSSSVMAGIYIDVTNPDWLAIDGNTFSSCSSDVVQGSNGQHIEIDGSVDVASTASITAFTPVALSAAGTWQPASVNTSGIVFSVASYCTAGALSDVKATTSCLQTAIDAACAATASGHTQATLFFPAGTYTFTSLSVSCQGVVLQGAGRGNRDQTTGTVFRTSSAATAPAITFWAKGMNGSLVTGNSSTSAVQTGLQDLDIINDIGNQYSSYASILFKYCSGCFANNLYFFTPTKALEVYAGSSATISNVYVDQLLLGGLAIEYHGNFTGSAGCTSVASCDQAGGSLALNNITVGQVLNGAVTSTCVYWHDLAQNLSMNAVACVGQMYGLKSDCAVNNAGESGCPNHLVADDFQCDFCTSGVHAVDSSGLSFTNSYFNGNSGNNGVNGQSGTPRAQNVIAVLTQNYPNAGESASFNGGQIAMSQGSCVWVGEANVSLSNIGLWGCNLGNTGGAGIEVNGSASASSQQLTGISVTGNTFCNRYGSAPTVMSGIYVAQSSTDSLTVRGNIFNQCYVGVASASQGSHNINTANVGPGAVMPAGIYAESCNACGSAGGVLTCQCLNASNQRLSTLLVFDTCTDTQAIANSNGSLTCH